MKGFIEVTQTDGSKTCIAVNAIKAVEERKDYVLITFDISTTRKNIVVGYLVSETYSEVVEKIKAAQ